MQRRRFIKTTTASSIALALGGLSNISKTHYISFSFDDGFKKSFYRIAEIHEEYGLNACLNVIAQDTYLYLTQSQNGFRKNYLEILMIGMHLEKEATK